MSTDPLAEDLRNAWPSRSWEGPTLVCGCGWETDMIDSGRNAQDCEDEFDAHMFEHLAKAARAFIAGEICDVQICDVQICEERDPSENAADLTYLDGLNHARRIAWGMADD